MIMISFVFDDFGFWKLRIGLELYLVFFGYVLLYFGGDFLNFGKDIVCV